MMLLLLSPVIIADTSASEAEVTVYDEIAVNGIPVTVRAETRKGFFRSGGELVDFTADGKSVGKKLSGGDGIAFIEFLPYKAGKVRIEASFEGSKGEGLILVLEKGGELVFIDVEGSLLEKGFTIGPRDGSRDAVDIIAKRSAVVYLRSGLPGHSMIKKWISEKGFPPGPLIAWDEGAIFEDVRSIGLKVRAVIGSEAVVSSAEGYGAHQIVFGEGPEHDGSVDDWSMVPDIVRGDPVNPKGDL